ncbi:hypothetical protein IFR05_003676 [Cadophora sp. M221]|nr:hypothetical protein IFR05_003676 [Cadophora sp. M221]
MNMRLMEIKVTLTWCGRRVATFAHKRPAEGRFRFHAVGKNDACAQCTGKTTLVKALEDHSSSEDNLETDSGRRLLRPDIITEVARSMLKEHSFIEDDITSSPARALVLQELILKAQVQAEAATSRPDGWFFSDRSGADPIVYAKKYVSDAAANNLLSSTEWLKLKKCMEQSLVII